MPDTISLNQSKSIRSSLLIVEDNIADITHYERLLEEFDHGFDHIVTAKSINEAKEIIQNSAPTCCLLDNFLPDGSAENLLEQLSSDDNGKLFPIIVITGQEDTSTAVKLMQKGAQDYLIKQQLDSMQLQRAVHNAMKTWNLQSQLNQLALYDPLTGLVNRALFMDRLERLYKESQRYTRPFALLYIDLDHFKYINDSHGHDAGDFILKEFGKRIEDSLRETDTAARLGGDEFAVILPDINHAKANHVAFKLVNELSFELPWKETTIKTSPSIGLATYPSPAQNHNELIREADMALFRAKRNGRAQYSAFDKSLERETRENQLLTVSLPKALQNRELQLAWQPIVNVSTGKVEYLEALVRWQLEDMWVPPPKIINLVLEQRLSDVFHEWLFNHSINQLAMWRTTNPDLKLSLNLPANLCHDEKIIQLLIHALEKHGISATELIVEITETHLINFPDETRKQLTLLADHGANVAIDDFGTGYSSMQYLASLPCKILKIDRSFFLKEFENNKNRQIIEAIVSLAHRLDMVAVAEGVENRQLLELCKELGCDYAQGYWLGAPAFAKRKFEEFRKSSIELGAKLAC